MTDNLDLLPVKRWHATGYYAYPAEETEDGEFVEYDDFRAALRRLDQMHELVERARRAEAERDELRAFAQDVMRAWPEGGVDGGELQEAAERHGLIEPSEPTQEERDEWGLEDGDGWYRRTALLEGKRVRLVVEDEQ